MLQHSQITTKETCNQSNTSFDKDFIENLYKYIQYSNKKKSNTKSDLWEEYIQDFKYDETHNTDIIAFQEKIEKGSRGYKIRTDRSNLKRYIFFFTSYVYLYIHKGMERFFVFFSKNLEKIFSIFEGKNRSYTLFDFRYAAAARYLKKKEPDVLRHMKAFFDDNSYEPTWNSLKSFYYLNFLLNNTELSKRKNIKALEVGAGLCNFSIFVIKYGRKHNHLKTLDYHIVDLPEMVSAAVLELKNHIPDAEIILPHQHESAIKPKKKSTIRFTFYVPDQIDLVPQDYFHLCVNHESFSEMLQDVADEYYKLFDNALTTNGYMYLVNREGRFQGKQDEANKEMNDAFKKYNCFWNLPFKKHYKVVSRLYDPIRNAWTTKPNIIYVAQKT